MPGDWNSRLYKEERACTDEADVAGEENIDAAYNETRLSRDDVLKAQKCHVN